MPTVLALVVISLVTAEIVTRLPEGTPHWIKIALSLIAIAPYALAIIATALVLCIFVPLFVPLAIFGLPVVSATMFHWLSPGKLKRQKIIKSLDEKFPRAMGIFSSVFKCAFIFGCMDMFVVIYLFPIMSALAMTSLLTNLFTNQEILWEMKMLWEIKTVTQFFVGAIAALFGTIAGVMGMFVLFFSLLMSKNSS